jgi:hypothetical protein
MGAQRYESLADLTTLCSRVGTPTAGATCDKGKLVERESPYQQEPPETRSSTGLTISLQSEEPAEEVLQRS